MKQFFRRQSLQRRIITAMVLIGLLPLSFAFVITYLEERRAIQDTIGKDFRQIAVEAAGKVELQVMHGLNEARQLATIPILRGAVIDSNRSYAGRDAPAVRRMVREWETRWNKGKDRGRFPDFVNKMAIDYLNEWYRIRKNEYVAILVTDSQGALVLSSTPHAEYDQRNTQWWQVAYGGGKGQGFVSDLVYDEALGFHVLEVAVPILDDTQKEAVGAVNVRLRSGELFKAIQEVRIGEHGHAMLLNTAGRPLICPVLSLDKHTVNAALLKQITQPTAGWVVAADDAHGARNAIVGFAPIEFPIPLAPESFGGLGVDWIAFVRQDPKETYAPLNQLVWRVSLGAVGVFLLMLLAGRFLARRIVRPIQALQEGAALLGRGELDHRLNIATGDEIEKLADTFNQMATSLRQHTEGLEHAVARRTRDLRESQERYKILFDEAADSVIMVNPGGGIIAVNRRQEAILKYPEEQLVGRRFIDLILPKYQASVAAQIQEILKGAEKTPTLEVKVFDRAGRPVPMELDLTGIGTGTMIYIMVQLRDITERKALERQLQEYSEGLEVKVQDRTREIAETKTYLENLLENANDVIYTLDLEQRFTYVNSKIEVWGYRKEDLLGRPYLSLMSRRHRGKRLRSTLDIGTKQAYEVEIITKEGELRNALVSVSPLQDNGGRIVGVLGIARDITEKKRLEQQVLSSEKLASIGKLAAGVAHEINNPLGGILNCLYNLRKGHLSPQREREYLTSMEDGLRRVQKIVRQLLDFSQQHDPELSPTEVNPLIERVLMLTNYAFEGTGVGLRRELGGELPLLMADRHMLEQVLMNLILNAVQAIKGNGMVTVRSGTDGTWCTIEVEDTGCGIPPDVLPKIFDPFFTTKGQGEGTGLGLSVSLGIVERHGGAIAVKSQVGQGTTFIVKLPALNVRSMAGKGA
ncbi:MAG TPA: PAS domain S-box protein [Nitrospirales bacterium]|nr:PAS domain S-box protein [Nitrospirales bacterium]